MVALEALKQLYLFKLRQSAGVMKLLNRQWNIDEWCDVGRAGRGVKTRWLDGLEQAQARYRDTQVRKMDIDAQGQTKVKKRGRKSNVQKQAELALIDRTR